MSISQTQCFLLAVVLAGVLGARRGWGREVITCAIILGTVLFLSNGGGSLLSRWLTSFQTSASSTATAGTISGSVVNANGQLLSELIFAGVTLIAYSVGDKWGAAPKSHNHRIAGIIPGAMNGAAMAYYVSNSILPGRQILVNSPSPDFASSELPMIIGIGLISLLVVLFVAGQATKK